MSSSRHEPLRRTASQHVPSSTSLPSHAPPAIKAGTQGGGQALGKHTNTEMSAKFGHDFSHVRVHTDSRAGTSADALGANAYALGGDIVFGAGKYNPGSRETDRLLAHELTHVAQQAQFGPGDWGRTSTRCDASEREADGLAAQVMMGRSVQVQAAPGAAVARDENGSQSSWIGDVFGEGSGGSASPSSPSATQNSWINNVFGNGPTGDSGGTSSSSPSASQSSWVDSTFGVDPSAYDTGGGSAASSPSAAHSSWINDVFGGSGGSASSSPGGSQSSWVDNSLGVDPSAF